jgi:hypothetical protein
MNPVRSVVAALPAVGAATAHARETTGTLALAGATLPLKAAATLIISSGDEPTSLLLLSEKPIARGAVLATDGPSVVLLNEPARDGVTHAKAFATPKRTSISAHEAGDSTQYLASRKCGLEASMSGAVGAPLEGRLRSTDEMSLQTDAEFTSDISKPTA